MNDTQSIKNLKLLRLQVDNIFGVKAMDFALDGNTAILLGPNEAGKSSAIEALALALGQEKDSDPTRNGEPQGRIFADFGQFTIERIWRKGKSPVWKVQDKEGNRIPSPSELFKVMINTIAYKPHLFISMKKTDRIHSLCQAIGFDLDTHQKQRKDIYDERTIIGRDVKRLKGHYEELPVPDSNTPDTEIDGAELKAEIQKLRELQEKRKDRQGKVLALSNEIERCNNSIQKRYERIEELKREISELESEKVQLVNTTKEIEAAIDEAPDYSVQIESKTNQILNIEAENSKIRAKKEYQDTYKEYQASEKHYKELSEQISIIDNKLIDALQSANLPEGLEIIDDDLYLNGVPFERLSTQQKLDLSLKIGMMIKPNTDTKLNVMCLDASQYDQKNRELLIRLANENDYQLIIEIAGYVKRDGNGKLSSPEELKGATTFYIEEGEATEIRA